MARKEYTQGEVIGIIGWVFGSIISIGGTMAYIGSQIFSKMIKATFWMTGKQIDMTKSLTEIRRSRHKQASYRNLSRIPNARVIEIEPSDKHSSDIMPMDSSGLSDSFRVIKMALDYSQETYEKDMLPIEEVVKTDDQALMMATAVSKLLKSEPQTRIMQEKIKIAEALIEVASLYQKYHSTGKTKYFEKAKKLFVDGQV